MSSLTPNNSNKSMTSTSRIFNRLLNNSSSSSNSNSNNMENNHPTQSTLNVITSAAAAAVSSIQNILNSSTGIITNIPSTSLSNKSNCSSSSSSTNSSAQTTPNQFRDLTNQSSSINSINFYPSNSNMITSSIRLEKKHFDKINKQAEKLLKNCQSDKMNLINSPPYIIDILPDICQAFNTIYFVYENKLHLLNDLDYFCVLIKNCLEKFQELLDLFKIAGKKMYEETSNERQKLVKYTLTFSHILAEMKSIFPKDIYEGQSFRIAKKDAADFWKSNFGDRIVVSWKEFEIKLNNVHKISNRMEVNSLRETIQLTRTKYVSIFEFDIFTRLFQPWNNLLNNWKFLVTEHPGYSAFSTYDEVHKRLQKYINKPGSYLFRLSCTKLGQWAIGYVTDDHKILQTIPQSLIQALIDGQKQGIYVYPDGRDIKIDISSAIAVTSASRIQISKEQYDMYCDLGTSFQVCKICSENNKDRKLEPCGHLICSSCLENWQELQSVPSCPFCRCEIKTFEPIVISPFENKQKQVENDTKLIQFEVSKDDLLENNVNYPSILSPISNGTESEEVVSKILNQKSLLFNQDNESQDSKYDIDSIINDKCNLNDSNFATSLSSLLSTPKDQISETYLNKNKLPPPPAFPPPNPPSLASSSQVLNPPNLPPPPPPTLTNSSTQSNLIVSNHTSSSKSIKLKIDNEFAFEHFMSRTEADKVKAICALYLADNDTKKALDILEFSNKL